MKRVLSIVLVFYLTLSALHPCADIMWCAFVENHADAEEEHQDTCSPFCICACCGASFIPQVLHALTGFLQKTIAASNFVYHPPFEQNFNPSFWQPPRNQAFTLNSYHAR